jgi:hypothetical protein
MLMVIVWDTATSETLGISDEAPPSASPSFFGGIAIAQ